VNLSKRSFLDVALVLFLVWYLTSCSVLNPILYDDGLEGNKETLPVEVSVLQEMAQYCVDVYENGTTVGKLVYKVYYSEGVTIIAIRGTANAGNVVSDIDARFYHDRTAETLFHRGFHDASLKIYDSLKKEHKDKTIYLTGHSLGGAIAQILSIWYTKDGHIAQVYTFGAPKIAVSGWWKFGIEHFRVAFDKDPVPFVPPFPFVHSGIKINPITLDWVDGGEEHRASFGQIDALDHSIDGYLKELLKH